MAFEFTELMVRLGMNVRDFEAGLSKANGKLESFGKRHAATMRSMGVKIAAFGAATTVGLGMAFKSFAKFQEGLTVVMTLVTDVNDEIRKQFSETTKRLSKDWGKSTDVLLKSLFDIQSAVGNSALALEIYEAATKLSVAGNTDMAQATSGTLTLMESYGDVFKDAADATDLLFKAQEKSRGSVGEIAVAAGQFAPIASQMKTDVNELFAVFAQMTVAMGNTNEASTAMTNVLKSLLIPTAEMTELMEKELGVTAQSAIEKHGLSKVLAVLSKVRKEEIGLIVPGLRGLKGLMSVTSELTKVEEFRLEIMNRKGAVQEALAKREKDAAFQMDQMKQSIAGLWREIGEALVPTILKLATNIKALVRNILKWKTENEKLFATYVKITGGIGLFSIALGGLLLVLPGIIQLIILLNKAIIGLKASTLGLATATGGLAIAVTGIAAALGVLIYKLWEWYKADQDVEKANKALKKSFIKQTDEMIKGIDDLLKSNKKLTKGEKFRLIHLKQEMLATRLHTEAIMWDSEKVEENANVIGKSNLALRKQLINLENVINVRQLAATEAKIAVEIAKEESTAIIYLGSDIQDLVDAFRIGKKTEEEFVDGMRKFIVTMKAAGYSTKQIVDVLEKMRSQSMSVKVEVVGVEDFEAVSQRIRGINQQLVLEELEGDEQKLQAHKFMIQNKLEDIDRLIHKEHLYLQQTLINAKTESDLKILEIQGLTNVDAKIKKERIDREKKRFKDVKKIMVNRYTLMTDLYGKEKTAVMKLGEIKLQKYLSEGEAAKTVAEIRIKAEKQVATETIKYTKASGEAYDKLATKAMRASTAGAKASGAQIGAPGSELPSGISYDPETKTYKNYARGTANVPRTGIYKLHRGESVVPSGQSFVTGLSPEKQSSAGAINLTVVNKLDSGFVNEMITEDPSAIINVIGRDAIRGGTTSKVISMSKMRRV